MADWSIAVMCFLAGGALAWFLRGSFGTANSGALRARIEDRERQFAEEHRELEAAREHHWRLARRFCQGTERRATPDTEFAEEERAGSEKLSVIKQAETALVDEKHQEAPKSELETRGKAVVELRPLRESLKKVGGKLGDIEHARVGARAALNGQIKRLRETHLSANMDVAAPARRPALRQRGGSTVHELLRSRPASRQMTSTFNTERRDAARS